MGGALVRRSINMGTTMSPPWIITTFLNDLTTLNGPMVFGRSFEWSNSSFFSWTVLSLSSVPGLSMKT